MMTTEELLKYLGVEIPSDTQSVTIELGNNLKDPIKVSITVLPASKKGK